MNHMLNMWYIGGNGEFVMRETHDRHVFGNSCNPASELMLNK
jgi:hypothetical protein